MKISNKKYKSLDLANEEERCENLIIDFIFSSTFGVIIAFLTFKKFSLAFLVYLLTRFIYYFGFEFLSGRTPGKYQTRTKVVDKHGEKPTVIQLIKRNLGRFISLVSGISDDERALHDSLSDTFVIKSLELNKIEFKKPLILIYNLSLMFFWIYVIATEPELETFDFILLIAISLAFMYTLVLGIRKIKAINNKKG